VYTAAGGGKLKALRTKFKALLSTCLRLYFLPVYTAACGGKSSTRSPRSASAYVSIRQHTSAYVEILDAQPPLCIRIRQHTSAYVSIRQHTSAYVSIRRNPRRAAPALHPLCQYLVLLCTSKASKAPFFVLAKQLSPRSASAVSVFCTFFVLVKQVKPVPASIPPLMSAPMTHADVCLRILTHADVC
jgi:hypothetical protein